MGASALGTHASTAPLPVQKLLAGQFSQNACSVRTVVFLYPGLQKQSWKLLATPNDVENGGHVRFVLLKQNSPTWHSLQYQPPRGWKPLYSL